MTSIRLSGIGEKFGDDEVRRVRTATLERDGEVSIDCAPQPQEQRSEAAAPR